MVQVSMNVLSIEEERAIANERVETSNSLYALCPKVGDFRDLLIDKYHALETLQKEYALQLIKKYSSLPVPDYAPINDEFSYEYFDSIRTKEDLADTFLDFEELTPVRDQIAAWGKIANIDLLAVQQVVDSSPYREVQKDILVTLGFNDQCIQDHKTYWEAVKTRRDRPISKQQARDAAFSDDLLCQTQARSPLLHTYLKQIQDGIKGSISAKFEKDWQAAMRHDVARDLGMRGLNDYLRENPHHIENLLSKAEAHAFHEMLDVTGMLRSLDASEISEEDRAAAILDAERDYELEYGPIKGGDTEKQHPIIEWAKARLLGESGSYAGNQEIEMYGYFNDESYWGFEINIPDYKETGEGGPIFTLENGKVTLDNMTRSPMLMEQLGALQLEFPCPG